MKYMTMPVVHPRELYIVHNSNYGRSHGLNTGRLETLERELSNFEQSLVHYSEYLASPSNLGRFKYTSTVFDTNNNTVIKAQHHFLTKDLGTDFKITVSTGKIKFSFTDCRSNDSEQTAPQTSIHRTTEIFFYNTGAGLKIKSKVYERAIGCDGMVYSKTAISTREYKLKSGESLQEAFGSLVRLSTNNNFRAQSFFLSELPKSINHILVPLELEARICLKSPENKIMAQINRGFNQGLQAA